MKKTLIALDVDETLIHDDRTLSGRTIKALKNCKKKGALVAISSTRNVMGCKIVGEQFDADYYCCHSGNVIVNKNGKSIYKRAFEQTDAFDFIDKFSHYTDDIYFDGEFCLLGKDTKMLRKWNGVPCSVEELKTKQVFKICILQNPKWNDEILKFCNERGWVVRPMRGAPYFLIVQSESDKYYALKKLMEIENIDELYVFGDDKSDLLSIEKADVGVAMANSVPDVLSAAKFVTVSNNEDGVAVFLEDNFLSK